MKFLKQIRKNDLFADLTEEEINAFFDNVNARMVKKSAGKIVAIPTDVPSEACIVIDGNIVLYTIKSDGTKEVVNSIVDGAMFGAEQAVSGVALGYFAASARDTELLYLDIAGLLDIGNKPFSANTKVYCSFIRYLSDRIMQLESNNGYITIRGMRKKIAKLIYDKYVEQKMFDVRIGMDRNQMAKFLNVSRPSMSREMIRMRDEGIILFRKDAITITDIDKLKQIIGESAE